MDGITVHTGEDATRLEIGCVHQRGVLYATRAEGSWVCDNSLLHAHALAGFMRELTALADPEVKALMKRWGVYYRELPLEAETTPAKAP